MSDIIPTVKVKPWGKSQGEFVEINGTDFDPKVHELLDGPAKASAEKPKENTLTKAELEAHLKGLGVEIPKGANKAVLVGLLEQHTAGATEQAGE